MKHLESKILLTMLMSMIGIQTFSHDIEVVNAEGVTIYYNYIHNNTELEVSYRGSYSNSYSNEYSGDVVIPETVNYDGTTYSVTSIGSYAFNGCSGLTSVTIPNSVTAIGSSAFKGCTGLTSVTIGNSVTSISSSAFSGCRSLESVTIGNSMTSIGNYAFSECTSLTSVTIPNSVTSIGSSAFSGCSGLTEVNFNATNCTTMGEFYFPVFKGCSSLTTINIGDNVETIPSYAFFECTGLISVTIPNSVTSIGRCAFYKCTGLTSITIPNSVTSISDYAFDGCYGLTSVSIPSSVTSVGLGAFDGTSWYYNQPNGLIYAGKVAYRYKGTMPANTNIVLNEGTLGIAAGAFRECNGLTSIYIPNSVTDIGHDAFYYCVNLNTITFPNSVRTIGAWAFQRCKALTSITIPSGVESIGKFAFFGCEGLISLTVESGNLHYDSRNKCNAIIETSSNTLLFACNNTTFPNSVTSIGDWAFSCLGLSSLIIPNSIISIGDYAFSECLNLTSITIPQSITSIGDYAFQYCDALTSVTVNKNEPIEINGSVFPSREVQTLYVPLRSKSAYEFADYWKEFKEIVEVSNIGSPTANTLLLTGAEAYKGKQVQLPVALNNQHEITAFQFDLYLPAGVTVATKSSGKMMIETTERMEGTFTISSNTIDNFVRVTGYSADGDAFTGNSGDILKVTLNIASSVADGDYSINLKDIVLSDVNNIEYHPADATCTLTVKSYMLGDVDNSGAVNINDVVCIINHILNKPVSIFIAEAADVDGSGTININDVVTLINRFILMKDGAPKRIAAVPMAAVTDDNYLHLDAIEINPGETLEIPLLLTNVNTTAAVQGNILLPDGLSFVTKSNGRLDVKNNDARAEDFTLSCALQDDASLTFAQYSGDGFTYEGNEGSLFTFKIKAADDAVAGTYDVVLRNVVLSIDGVGYEYSERTSKLTILSSTGIDSLLTNGQPFDIYDLNGRKLYQQQTTLPHLQRGVYIINGRKVVVK